MRKLLNGIILTIFLFICWMVLVGTAGVCWNGVCDYGFYPFKIIFPHILVVGIGVILFVGLMAQIVVFVYKKYVEKRK